MDIFLEQINEYILKHAADINAWLVHKSEGHKWPIFTSVDLRNAGYKIAPVDTNLFPAGFNNISKQGLDSLVTYIKEYMSLNYPSVHKVIIFPENFTRNLKYLESLSVLFNAFSKTGLDVKLGSTLIENDFHAESGLVIEAFKKHGDIVQNLAGWSPDLIVLNNDLTDGIPDSISSINIPVTPNPMFGWHRRLKHKHFLSYDKLVHEFCSLHHMDPWILSTYFEHCGSIDFKNKKGLECLAQSVDNVIIKITDKYAEHGINETPFVFVKADQGTYGMGVMVVRSGEEILSINKKSRHSMHALKSGVQNTNLIAQEGVPTIEKHEGHSSETMAYMCGDKVIEMFSRFHSEKDPYSNLNSSGMQFANKNMCINDLKSLVARLAALSTIFEL